MLVAGFDDSGRESVAMPLFAWSARRWIVDSPVWLMAVDPECSRTVPGVSSSKSTYNAQMLTRFLYLDSPVLSQYLSALEGGSLTGSTQRTSKSGSAEGGIDAKVLKGSGSRSREDEEERTLVDTDAAMFDRLRTAALADPERLGWIDVLDPDTDFHGIGVGAMVDWECEIYVPDPVKFLSKAGEMSSQLAMMRSLLPSARALGLDTTGVPDDRQLSAMEGIVSGMASETLVVGEDDETEWRVAGHLSSDFPTDIGGLEGRARMLGKVARILRPGQWMPFVTFPGMNLLPREKRRELERTKPAEGKEGDYLQGPALMLDVLAVYR